MAGTAKKFWNLSRNNKMKTMVAAYTSIADKCSANLESAKVNTHEVLKGWHYFDQGSQANREKWGDCEMFWRQNVSQKVLEPALEQCVTSEMRYRDEHKMGYIGPRVAGSTNGSNSGTGTSSGSGNSGTGNKNTGTSSADSGDETQDNGRTKKFLLLTVTAVAGFMLIKKRK